MQGMKEESSHNPQLDNPTKISMYLKGKGNHLREQAPSIWSLTVNQCRKQQKKWRTSSQATTKSNNRSKAITKRKQQQTAPKK
jgi:hypothetical protein